MTLDDWRQTQAIALKDGTRVDIRPAQPDDAPRLQAFHQRLSPESIYLRWLIAHPVLSDAEAAAMARVDYDHRMAFVAVCPDNGDQQIVGIAHYAVVNPAVEPHQAEAAVVVQDDFQARGLGTTLLRRLLDFAREAGITTWVAEISAENRKMMRFIRRGGMPMRTTFEGGALQVYVDITAGPSDEPDGAKP